MELVEVIKRIKVNVACLQETKRKGDSAKELTDGYKHYYAGKNNARNGVGIVVTPPNLDSQNNIEVRISRQ